MILRLSVSRVARRAQRAFTLVEVMVAMAIIGIAFTALYAGITMGTTTIAQARESLRANQILTDRIEECRLYSWDYLTNSSNIPTNFVEPFYPTNSNLAVSDVVVGTNGIGSTFSYYGTMSIGAVSLTNNYADGLRLITVTLVWTNGSVQRTRTISTYVARNGMQTFVQ